MIPDVLLSLTSLTILVATMASVIVRPRGIGVGWSAFAGATLSIALGIVPLRSLADVAGIVGDATIAFVAIVIISLVLDEAGMFAWAALHVARWGGGRPLRLLVLVVLLGAVTSALMANDGAALILTPIVAGVVAELRMDARAALAYVVACGFIADAGSLPLTISNLVNIIAADAFGLGFGEYAALMVPVGIVAVIASLGMLALTSRRSLPAFYAMDDLRSPASAIRDPLTFRAGFAVLTLLLAGYLSSNALGVPIAVIASAGAIVLLALAAIGRRLHPVGIVRGAPWSIIVFSASMYVIILGLQQQGLLEPVVGLFHTLGAHGLLATTLGVGAVVAVLSCAINNLPAILVAVLAIQGAGLDGASETAMIHASVVGADLGPKITPIGSLATLLWLEVLARKGIRITWGGYMRSGIVLTVPVLAVTLLALAGMLALAP